MTPSAPAIDDPCIRIVGSFHELLTTPFVGRLNAICWPRELPGDFREVADHLDVRPGITTLEESLLYQLPVSASGRTAIDSMLADLELLRAHDLSPVLDCVEGHEREEEPGPVRTDVSSFHVDQATIAADTWLCTYLGASSEGLRNEEARRRVDIPGTRAALRQMFGGGEEKGFLEFLKENFYDLHYAPLPGARPFSFGVGNLWRIALEYPGCRVPPCIHRAPCSLPGQPRRLLLIS